MFCKKYLWRSPNLNLNAFDIQEKFVKKNECKRKCSLDLEELVVAGLIKRGHRRTIINQRVSIQHTINAQDFSF